VTASRALCHPIAVLAIATLVVNDHVLKAAYPGLVTGKLSDVAGLAFFPLLVAAALEQLRVARGERIVSIAAMITGVGFAAIKLSPFAGDVFRFGLAALQWPVRAAWFLVAGHGVPALAPVSLVADPTDLFALVALAIPLALVTACDRSRAELAAA
jgi:hypothetical protein